MAHILRLSPDHVWMRWCGWRQSVWVNKSDNGGHEYRRPGVVNPLMGDETNRTVLLCIHIKSLWWGGPPVYEWQGANWFITGPFYDEGNGRSWVLQWSNPSFTSHSTTLSDHSLANMWPSFTYHHLTHRRRHVTLEYLIIYNKYSSSPQRWHCGHYQCVTSLCSNLVGPPKAVLSDKEHVCIRWASQFTGDIEGS